MPSSRDERVEAVADLLAMQEAQWGEPSGAYFQGLAEEVVDALDALAARRRGAPMPDTLTWNATPERRKRVSDTLLDLWESAEADDEDQLAEAVKDTLDRLGLPWVRLPGPEDAND